MNAKKPLAESQRKSTAGLIGRRKMNRSPRESLRLASGALRPYCLHTNDRAKMLMRP